MTRRFEEIAIDMEDAAPPRCPHCKSIHISADFPLEGPVSMTHITAPNWRHCKDCETVWMATELSTDDDW